MAKLGRGGAVAVIVVHVAGFSALVMSVKACGNGGGGKNHFALDVYVRREAKVGLVEVGEEVLVAKVGRGGAVAVVVFF